MSGAAKKPAVYNIPAGLPFARTLAAYVLEESKKRGIELPQIRILLPTRRACRTLREAFLQLTGGRPLLLPRLQPLGDVDEEELSFALTDNAELAARLDLPPSLPPLRRRLMLARAVQGIEGFTAGFDHALKLADALGHFMDQIYTENLDMADLANLVPEEFATHWQVTLDFLKILSEHWPKILEENGVIDAADRRNRLLEILAEYWRCTCPGGWIIAAGSTGSIPGVARLLSVISRLPQGEVILPGLDQDMDEESWNTLNEAHPQFGMREILKIIGTERIGVSRLDNGYICEPQVTQRVKLASEVMRPADTSNAWLSLDFGDLRNALSGISLYNCENQQAEAQIIALLMREAPETPENTCALITPDRTLARRVKTACERWNITVDDSAGQKLSDSVLGSYLRLSLDVALTNLSPVALLAWLKHPYSSGAMPRKSYTSAVSELERRALRGLRPAPGIEGLRERLGDEIPDTLQQLLRVIETNLRKFMDLLESSNELFFNDILKVHLEFCENWASRGDCPGADILWRGDEGEAASTFFSELLDSASLMPPLSGRTYKDVLLTLLDSVKTRPAYGTHPRLMILGQLEARLIHADTIILAGLNEGTWPADPGHDPWMSRPMRKQFGLPSPERAIGLAAHDFVQGFCNRRVILTRSKRVDGNPTTPARWLQRLETVLTAAGLPPASLQNGPHSAYLKHLEYVEAVTPVTRPAPRPPVEKRPRRLSATKIETWLKDPYSIYARYILRFKPLEKIEKQPDAAERGTLLHDIFDRFVSQNPRDLPPDSFEQLQTIAREELTKFHDDPALWRFWWPRFEQLCNWFLEQEGDWRTRAVHGSSEAKGAYTLDVEGSAGEFTLSAIADRIDKLKEGGAAIIDYKSGGTYSKKAIESGALPQLPLEALILLKGGFPGISEESVDYLGYWKMTGGSKAGEITAVEGTLDTVIESAEAGLHDLIRTFDNPETPYYSLPCPANAPRFNDYEHLARIKEWTALDEAGGEEAA